MPRYRDIPAPEGMQHCPRCRTDKPLADFEPAPKRACGRSQQCHDCLASEREERAAVRQISKESAARMLEIQYRPTPEPIPATPPERLFPSEFKTAEYFRQVDATRRRQRLQRRK